ncbi:hypothetical protein [Nocardioides bruguierae]|uniref:Uncharacterized protein n=1 Tax=Nocardioides bruguierae TaxID=2945102 RepID=A0A9X2D4M3_9ACTN|nr:hypothetical protein [Nocardioides bruguierae]MCL8025834.1 hypothetical protein [Nocardioides bruguierae]MCM0618949.1 hypothetical protein [Nocardioides bruguierae]
MEEPDTDQAHPGLPTQEPGAQDARVRDELLAAVSREEEGSVPDAAVWAAIASVERIACHVGTTDAEELTVLLTDGAAAIGNAETLRLVGEAHDSVVRGLGYRARGMVVDAGVLNPEGGVYPVTTDARLLRAAVRAAHRTCAHVPYYGARYADSAGRYSGTDSAWLAQLADQPLTESQRQVDWLTRLLAARGMPSWLMERHLGDLVDALEEAAGSQAAGSLPQVRDELARRRQAVVPDVILDEAERVLAQELGEEPAPVGGAGALLAAAVADVGSGLLTHDRALFTWLTDPARCGAPARRALESTRASVYRVARVDVPTLQQARGRRPASS